MRYKLFYLYRTAARQIPGAREGSVADDLELRSETFEGTPEEAALRGAELMGDLARPGYPLIKELE